MWAQRRTKFIVHNYCSNYKFRLTKLHLLPIIYALDWSEHALVAECAYLMWFPDNCMNNRKTEILQEMYIVVLALTKLCRENIPLLNSPNTWK